jgi:hypothetical protein
MNEIESRANSSRREFLKMSIATPNNFGAGMITGWGAHHVDTAHWA